MTAIETAHSDETFPESWSENFTGTDWLEVDFDGADKARAIEDDERWPLSLTFVFVAGFCTVFWVIAAFVLSAVF